MNYDTNFYDTINEGSRRSADVVVPMVLDLIKSPTTMIDVGCGEGVWTRAFTERGVVGTGVDGDYVDRSRLCIPEDKFIAKDLAQPLGHLGTFDLAISLEVAEHLPESRADSFVAELCGLADVVLFSGAIPGQTGVGHINEQWPGYWAEKFESNGYKVSGALRWVIWDDVRVENWYRQNLLVAATSGLAGQAKLHALMNGPMSHPFPVVHPVLHDHLRSFR